MNILITHYSKFNLFSIIYKNKYYQLINTKIHYIIDNVMRVLIKAFATLREILGSTGQIQLELKDNINVNTLLNILAEKYGEQFTRYIFNEKGELNPFVKIFINGRNIEFLKGLETELKNGDVITLIPPVAGG
ncbi:MAG: ubiquitin-like small modifier protein 1 [Nitrososphaerales archaeon]